MMQGRLNTLVMFSIENDFIMKISIESAMKKSTDLTYEKECFVKIYLSCI